MLKHLEEALLLRTEKNHKLISTTPKLSILKIQFTILAFLEKGTEMLYVSYYVIHLGYFVNKLVKLFQSFNIIFTRSYFAAREEFWKWWLKLFSVTFHFRNLVACQKNCTIPFSFSCFGTLFKEIVVLSLLIKWYGLQRVGAGWSMTSSHRL